MLISPVSPVLEPRVASSGPVESAKSSSKNPDSFITGIRENLERNIISVKDQLLLQLAAIDRQVRAHEVAHAAVGGRYAGAPSFSFQRGPNGKLYAVGGSVDVDTAPVRGNPQATLEKATVVRRAALAPAQPSAQDRAIAAQATQMALKARAEIEVEAAKARAEEFDQAAGDEPEARNRIESALESYRTVQEY